jgi:hypothetical protein
MRMHMALALALVLVLVLALVLVLPAPLLPARRAVSLEKSMVRVKSMARDTIWRGRREIRSEIR